MATLSPRDIATAAKQAGFPADQVQTAVAVALAESGGNPAAVNTANRNGSVDYGLWQINTIHGPLLSQGDKFNPNDNAKMAYTVWSRAGGKWTPWSVYNNRRYVTFMPQAALAAASANQQSGSGNSPAGASATGSATADPNTPQGSAAAQPTTSGLSMTGVAEFVSQLVSGGLWLRLGSIVFGAALILFSLNKLTGVGDTVVSLGTKAAKMAITKGVVK